MPSAVKKAAERETNPEQKKLALKFLVAAYQPRSWPRFYESRFGRLSGIVAELPSVRARHGVALARGLTQTRDPVAWLDDEVRRDDGRDAERAGEEASVLYRRALAAYRAARGTRPSLMQEGL